MCKYNATHSHTGRLGGIQRVQALGSYLTCAPFCSWWHTQAGTYQNAAGHSYKSPIYLSNNQWFMKGICICHCVSLDIRWSWCFLNADLPTIVHTNVSNPLRWFSLYRTLLGWLSKLPIEISLTFISLLLCSNVGWIALQICWESHPGATGCKTILLVYFPKEYIYHYTD